MRLVSSGLVSRKFPTTKKVPTEIGDYGIIYDNLYDAIFNHGEKIIKDEEVIEVLTIIEEATKVAKEV